MSVTLNGTSGLVFSDGTIQGTAAGMPFRNRIINGSCIVAQRGTTSTASTSGYYAVDHVYCWNDVATNQTWSQSTDAPAGFVRSAAFNCATAKTSLAANDQIRIRFPIEMNMVTDFNNSSNGTDVFVLSFWVKTNKTGTYPVALIKHGTIQRHVVPTFVVNAADTWEYKSITVPADSTGAFTFSTENGLSADFILAAGSTFRSGTQASSWQTRTGTDGNIAPTSTVNILDSTSNYFRITGVQLEKAAAATSFEHRPYPAELALCQRYYELVGVGGTGGGSTNAAANQLAYVFAVEKRGSPSVQHLANYLCIVPGQTTHTATSTTLGYVSTRGMNVVVTTSTAPSATAVAFMYRESTNNIAVISEL